MAKNKVKHTANCRDKILVKYVDELGIDKSTEIRPEWYFIIRQSDVDKAKELIDCRFEPGYTGYSKIFLPSSNKDYIRDAVFTLENAGIETYEADLLPDKRWFIDKRVEIAENFKTLYWDIETDDTQDKLEVGRDRIVSIATVDQDGHERFFRLKEFTDEGERTLLMEFRNHVKNYDLLCGWNSTFFDTPYVKIRCKKLGVSTFFLSLLANYDLLKRCRFIFRSYSTIKSFSLENISQHFLGRGKIKHTEKIIDMWKNDHKLLRKYNLEDCRLVRDIDKKLGISEMMIRQSSWCGVPPSQFGLYSIIDALIIKKAHEMGKYVRTSLNSLKERNPENVKGNEDPNDTNTEKTKYTGAIVLEPTVGLYDKLYVFDFKSLYPSIIRTSNIGYDTLLDASSSSYVDPGCIINPGTVLTSRKSGIIKPTHFRKQPSVINITITELLKKRTEYKKLKLKMIEEGKNHGPEWESAASNEIIVKELSNSLYGIMGLEYGRYFSVDIAESITLFGQWCLNFAKTYFESIGYKVIYGDTDSVFVSTSGKEMDVEKELEGFHIKLKEKLLDFNITDCFIELAFDKQYERFLMVAKKTYAGHVKNIEGKKTDDIYARGLEYIKKNTFKFAAIKQKELVETILRKGMTREEAIKFLEDTRAEFYNTTFEKSDLILQQKVSKGFDEYKTKPIHVRLIEELSNRTGERFTGSEVEYIITSYNKKMDGILSQDFDGKYDKNYYWENKTLPVLLRITEPAFGIEELDNRIWCGYKNL